MPEKINSATRFIRIFNTALSRPTNEHTLEVWAKSFDLTSEPNKKRNSRIYELILTMSLELENLREQANSIGLPSSVYDADLNLLENALEPALINSQWSNVRQYITPEVLKSLSYLSHLLPDEEAEISDSDLSDLSEKIFELKDLLNDAEISVRLRKLIEHHIYLIEKAILDYPISGASCLRRAAHSALGELIESKDEFESEKGSQVASKLGELWGKVNTTTDVALKLEKVGQLANKAWDYIGWINQ